MRKTTVGTRTHAQYVLVFYQGCLEILRFRVRFRFLIFGIFCFRFQLRIELVASEFTSASGLFH